MQLSERATCGAYAFGVTVSAIGNPVSETGCVDVVRYRAIGNAKPRSRCVWRSCRRSRSSWSHLIGASGSIDVSATSAVSGDRDCCGPTAQGRGVRFNRRRRRRRRRRRTEGRREVLIAALGGEKALLSFGGFVARSRPSTKRCPTTPRPPATTRFPPRDPPEKLLSDRDSGQGRDHTAIEVSSVAPATTRGLRR